jgi:hypothetical protein
VAAGNVARLAGLLVLATGSLAAPAVPVAGGPKPETIESFDRYIRLTESRLDAAAQPGGRLWDGSAERRRRLRQGAILCEPRHRRNLGAVPHGLVHDWVGAIFIPRARVDDVLAVVRDYDHHQTTYRPEVVASRILTRRGDDFTVSLRLLKRKGITVVLDTEHEVRYRKLAEGSWESRSRSVRISELDQPGSPRERPLPAGRDHGFLWRLNSYWKFHEADGGTYVECEAISLSRTVPASLAWLIDPIVRGLPRESMVNTMRATRIAVEKRSGA